jgi:hypothetical protein
LAFAFRGSGNQKKGWSMKKARFLKLACGLCGGVAALALAPAALAGPGQLRSAGVVNLSKVPSSVGSTAPGPLAGEFSHTSQVEVEANKALHKHHGKPSTTPNPAGLPVVTSNPGAFGFDALNHVDQRSANGGNQFSLEPPDQGLCVGAGVVVETVNTVVRVYGPTGTPLTGVVDLNTFFKLAAQDDRSIPLGDPGRFGPSLTDPRCYYDSDTGRFFLTVAEYDVDSATDAPTGPSAVLIAVTQTSDPTGLWNLYSLDTTDNGTGGTPSHSHCPCLPDQPLIGADAYGFYVTTNEFGPITDLGNAFFNGAQIYALSKTALESGTLPAVVQFENPKLAEGMSYTVQPATSPNGQYELGAGGTEYFLSALQFVGATDNRIAAWALTNTSSLSTSNPQLKLTLDVVRSEDYAFPPDATQKDDGVRPLGTSLGEPVELIAGNDDRMQQVVFAHGLLWSGLNTGIGGGDRVGIAWFAVSPRINGGGHGKIKATMAGQGYIAVDGENVLFPSIGVNQNGRGSMVFTLSGPDYFPSSAYVTVDGTGTPTAGSAVHLVGAGNASEDGFTGYPEFGGNGTARWGDYSAAVAGPDGSIWMASEYIPGAPGEERTVNANWGTFISNLIP